MSCYVLRQRPQRESPPGARSLRTLKSAIEFRAESSSTGSSD